jgi:predicted acyltransferase
MKLKSGNPPFNWRSLFGGDTIMRGYCHGHNTIFALGLLLNFIPSFDLAHLRIPGVLQRIAPCNLFASLIFLKSSLKARAGIAFACLPSYWLIMKLVPVPGFGAGWGLAMYPLYKKKIFIKI